MSRNLKKVVEEVKANGEEENETEDDFEVDDDSESVDREADFKYLLEQWKKDQDLATRRSLVRTMFNNKLDPHAVHAEVLELGGYEKVLSEDSWIDQLVLRMPGPKTHIKMNKAVYRKRMRTFVEALRAFEGYLQTNNGLDQEVSLSFMTAAATVMLDQRKELESFLNNKLAQDGKHRVVSSQVKSLIQRLIAYLGDAEIQVSKLQDNQSKLRSILWLGENAVGKSFMLNLLLLLSERPHWEYNSRPHSNFEAILRFEQELTAGEVHSKELEDEQSNDVEVRIKRNVLIRGLENSSVQKSSLIVIEPATSDFSRSPSPVTSSSSSSSTSSASHRQEVELEEQYLHALKHRCEDYVQWYELAKKRGGVLPGFILTSAVQASFRSTTMHVLKIRQGAKWHFAVSYRSLADLEAVLRNYDFAKSDEVYQGGKKRPREWDENRVKHHERMMNLLKAVVVASSDPVERLVSSGELGSEVNLEEDYGPRGILFPREGRPIQFKDDVKRIAGKTFVFLGKGQNALEDRIYIRRMLHGVLFQGLFGEFKPAPGTAPDAWNSDGPPLDPNQAPDRFIISEVILYAPSMLLESDVEWQDAPGSHDPDPEKYTNLVEALDSCEGLMMLSGKTEDPSVLDLFEESIIPRMWKKTSGFSRFSHLLLNEKMSTDDYIGLARAKAFDEQRLQAQRAEMMRNLYKTVKLSEAPEAEPNSLYSKEEVLRKTGIALNIGTWRVLPLMYTSLLLNSSLRTNVELVPETKWNLLNDPNLRGKAPTVRDATQSALVVTFGRNLLETLLTVSQSAAQDILRQVRSEFKEARQQLSKLESDTKLEERPPSLRTAAETLRSHRRKKDGKSWTTSLNKVQEKLRDQYIGQLGEMAETLVSQISLDKYWSTAVSKLRSEVFGKMRSELKPDLAADFIAQEKRYGVKRIFSLLSGLVDFSSVIRMGEIKCGQILEDFNKKMKAFLVDLLLGARGQAGTPLRKTKRQKSGGKNDVSESEDSENAAKSWLNLHVERYMETQGKLLTMKKMAGPAVAFMFPQSDTANSARTEVLSDWESNVRRSVSKQFGASMRFSWKKSALNSFSSDIDAKRKVDWVIMKIEENLPKLRANLQRAVQEEVQITLEAVTGAITKALVVNATSAATVITTQFIDYVIMFNSDTNKRAEVAQGLNGAIGFVTNRINELLENDRLAEVDGFWLESYAKSKFVLDEFLRNQPAWLPVAPKLFTGNAAGLVQKHTAAREVVSVNVLGSGNAAGLVQESEGQPIAAREVVSVNVLGAEHDVIPPSALRQGTERNKLGESGAVIVRSESHGQAVVLQRTNAKASEASEVKVSKANINFKGLQVGVCYGPSLQYRVEVIGEVSSGQYDCIYIGQSPLGIQALFEDLRNQKGRSKVTAASLVKAVLNCTKEFGDLKNLPDKAILDCWAKLTESAFPVIENSKMYEKARSSELQIKLFDIGNGKLLRSCEDVFNHWFGAHFTLAQFLKNYSTNVHSSEFVLPLLLGAAEMFASPFLVIHPGSQKSRRYLIEPVFRRGSHVTMKKAFVLRWGE